MNNDFRRTAESESICTVPLLINLKYRLDMTYFRKSCQTTARRTLTKEQTIRKKSNGLDFEMIYIMNPVLIVSANVTGADY